MVARKKKKKKLGEALKTFFLNRSVGFRDSSGLNDS